MAVKKKHKMMLKKLKKQVRMLQRKENQAKNKLKSAIKKMNKLNRSYQKKLVEKARMMKEKITAAQAATYAKAAVRMERHLLKGIDAKSKALESVLTKFEKKHVAKLKKGMAKKGKKSAKSSTPRSKKAAKGRGRKKR